MSYSVPTDEHGNAIPPKQELGSLQPEVVKKPKVVKCPKCGSTTFDLFKTIEVMDMLSFDDKTGEPYVLMMTMDNALPPDYKPHKHFDRAVCSECGELIPKELFAELPDEIETELNE